MQSCTKNTPVTPRQPTRLTTTNGVEINRREQGVNTCLWTTCHGSSWSVANFSQTGSYSLWLLIDFSSILLLSVALVVSVWRKTGRFYDWKRKRCSTLVKQNVSRGKVAVEQWVRNPGRDISFPICIRKEIETRKSENDIKLNGN